MKRTTRSGEQRRAIAEKESGIRGLMHIVQNKNKTVDARNEAKINRRSTVDIRSVARAAACLPSNYSDPHYFLRLYNDLLAGRESMSVVSADTLTKVNAMDAEKRAEYVARVNDFKVRY